MSQIMQGRHITHHTVDPKMLTNFATAREIMHEVSGLLWQAQGYTRDNKEDTGGWHDWWVNSTTRKGVRTIRIRTGDTPLAIAALPEVRKLLAGCEDQYKIYRWSRMGWAHEDPNKDYPAGKLVEHRYRFICVKLFYASRPTKNYEYNCG